MSTHSIYLGGDIRKVFPCYPLLSRCMSFYWNVKKTLQGICVIARKKDLPDSIPYKSIAGRYRPVSYPDGPITARDRFIKNANWAVTSKD